MQENINDKLSKILSGSKLKRDDISSFLSSAEGEKLKNSLSEGDKKTILQKFMSMDEKEIGEKLKKADLSALDGISARDVIKKLR